MKPLKTSVYDQTLRQVGNLARERVAEWICWKVREQVTNQVGLRMNPLSWSIQAGLSTRDDSNAQNVVVNQISQLL